MCIAAAIIGAGVVGAAGAAIAGGEAASATTSASNAAIGAQQSALQQQTQLSAPYRGLGESAIPQLQQILGLAGPGGTAATPASIEATLAGMPGYQFAKTQGLEAVQNSAAAKGLLNSGNTLEALDQFGTGLADKTYESEVENLENTVATGQAAAAGQAANVGQAASNIGNIAVNQGQTLAGIDANTIAGITGAIGGGVNQYVELNTLKNLMSPSPGAGPG